MRGSLPFVVLAGIGIAGLGLGIVKRLSKPSDPRGSGISPRSSQLERRYIAADRLDCGAMLLAGSVLLDSSIEHYRGNFARAAMYMPLGSAGAAIFASGHGISRRSSDIVRVAMHASAVITGLVGLGFHALNIVKRPGGISWHNLFYAAPAGAPAALSLAGILGLIADGLRQGPNRMWQLRRILSDRAIAAVAAVGIAGTSAEAWLLHFRGAFHNPAMLVPVTVPPLASVLLGGYAARVRWAPRHVVRVALRATAATGLAGVAFHAYGVQRMMGGWRNWSQNVLDGPPLPAPPGYTGLALAGLAALELDRRRKHG